MSTMSTQHASAVGMNRVMDSIPIPLCIWQCLDAQASLARNPVRPSVCNYIRLSLVAFQLWRVLEQLAPEIILNFFFKTGDLSMVQLTQKIQKSEKKVKKTPKIN